MKVRCTTKKSGSNTGTVSSSSPPAGTVSPPVLRRVAVTRNRWPGENTYNVHEQLGGVSFTAGTLLLYERVRTAPTLVRVKDAKWTDPIGLSEAFELGHGQQKPRRRVGAGTLLPRHTIGQVSFRVLHDVLRRRSLACSTGVAVLA